MRDAWKIPRHFEALESSAELRQAQFRLEDEEWKAQLAADNPSTQPGEEKAKPAKGRPLYYDGESQAFLLHLHNIADPRILESIRRLIVELRKAIFATVTRIKDITSLRTAKRKALDALSSRVRRSTDVARDKIEDAANDCLSQSGACGIGAARAIGKELQQVADYLPDLERL